MHRRLAITALSLIGTAALAAPLPYPWRAPEDGPAAPLSARLPPPPGYTPVPVAGDGFGAWLRGLPMRPDGWKVHLFDGREKPRQDAHAAVVAIDVGDRDLQQCADAVMRLRAEYLLSRGEAIEFHPDRRTTLRFDPRPPDPGRRRFRRYLTRVFAEAGTASLAAELPPARGPIEPGDVLIQGGHPGHALLVLDVAADEAGRRRLLLGQSYMPAQELHVVRNLEQPEAGAWFDEAALDAPGGLKTPEWRPFRRADLRRFR